MEAILNYLRSGGAFSDIMIPCTFIKKLCDSDTLQQFDNDLEAEITNGKPKTIKLLDDTLKMVVLNCVPQRARRTTQLERVNQKASWGRMVSTCTHTQRNSYLISHCASGPL